LAVQSLDVLSKYKVASYRGGLYSIKANVSGSPSFLTRGWWFWVCNL